jgi:hypothetical protein
MIMKSLFFFAVLLRIWSVVCQREGGREEGSKHFSISWKWTHIKSLFLIMLWSQLTTSDQSRQEARFILDLLLFITTSFSYLKYDLFLSFLFWKYRLSIREYDIHFLHFKGTHFSILFTFCFLYSQKRRKKKKKSKSLW